MNRIKGFLVTAALSAVAVLAVACGNGEAASTATLVEASPAAAAIAPAPPLGSAQPSAPGNQPSESVPAVGAPEPSAAVGAPEPVALGAPKPAAAVSVTRSSSPASPPTRSEPLARPPAVAPAPAPAPAAVSSLPVASPIVAPLIQTTSGQAGIWVSGQGRVTLEPDLAILNLGVEANAKTVAASRDQAATAMDAIVLSLTANGVEIRDIQTRFFNISPQYEFTQVTQNGIRTNKQVLIGYRVSNSVSVKIRDLSAVGPIIDNVADAGGDATRINGISFTVEDTAPFLVDLREAAVADALAKADQFARLAGVSLGRLEFISESGSARPQARAVQEFAVISLAAAAPDTSISGGELEISLTVQAVFGIQ